MNRASATCRIPESTSIVKSQKERREEKKERVSEEIMAENPPSLMKNNLHIEGPQQTSNKITKIFTPRYI